MSYQPKQQDCMDCYKQYQISKTFNYDCPMYDEKLNLKKGKCFWIDVMAEEIDICLIDGCNKSLIEKLTK